MVWRMGVDKVKKLYNRIKAIVGEITEDGITLYSAQASFYLIISAFPFMMLLLSLVGYFIPIPKQTIIDAVQSFLPTAVRPAIAALAEELFGKSISVISFSAITALWSASRGIAAVGRGIKRVYKTPQRNFFIAEYAMSIVYTLIFIVVIFLTLILQVFGNVLIGLIGEYVVFVPSEIVFLKGILFFALMCIIFQLMYYFFDRRRLRLKFHLPGAAFSAVGWMIFSNIFSLYIDNFADYSYIYGSLTAVVLMLLWIYFCVIILLLGAKLNSILFENEE